jgi:hypothetical protein
MGDTRAKRNDNARSFMSGSKWRSWLDGPITISCVEVGMTNPACDDLYQDFAWLRRRNGDFSNRQRLAEFLDDSCFHHFLDAHGLISDFMFGLCFRARSDIASDFLSKISKPNGQHTG